MGRKAAGLTAIAAYGKLPISREFLEFGCDSSHARALVDFLHGTARALADLPPRRDAIRLCLPIEPGSAYAVASIWPSADEGGRRRFPFCIFTICSPEELPASHPGLSTATGPLHEYHEQICARMATLSNPAEFEQCLDEEGRPPSFLSNAAKVYAARARTYPTTRWAAALFGTQAHRFLMSLWRLKQLLEADEALSECAGVRLPLVRGHALETQADAWLGLMARHHLAGPEPRLLQGRFGPGATASLVVFFRAVDPGDFVVAVDRPVPGLVDLTMHKEVVDQNGLTRFSALIQGRLMKSCSTLATFSDILTDL